MLSFVRATLLVVVATGLVGAAPADDVNNVAAYKMVCNNENLDVDNGRWIANDLRNQAAHWNHPWPCPLPCADNHKQADTSHGFQIESHGSGDKQVAVTSYTLNHLYDYALCVDVAAAIDAILDTCGARGGSALARDSENCVIHVNRNWV